MYVLSLSYPFDLWNSLELSPDTIITNILEREPVSSGAGFGERDMQFHFNTEKEAIAAKHELLEFCHFPITIQDIKEVLK